MLTAFVTLPTRGNGIRFCAGCGDGGGNGARAGYGVYSGNGSSPGLSSVTSQGRGHGAGFNIIRRFGAGKSTSPTLGEQC
jgi:hypothetical protein